MSLEDHTRKQVQMNAVTRELTKRLLEMYHLNLVVHLSMSKCFFVVFKELPVTTEEFVQGEFQKYVNNNGFCNPSPAEEFDEIYAKA